MPQTGGAQHEALRHAVEADDYAGVASSDRLGALEGREALDQHVGRGGEHVEELEPDGRRARHAELLRGERAPERSVVDVDEGREHAGPPPRGNPRRGRGHVHVHSVVARGDDQEVGAVAAGVAENRGICGVRGHNADAALATAGDGRVRRVLLDRDHVETGIVEGPGEAEADRPETGHDHMPAKEEPEPHELRLLPREGEEPLDRRVAGDDRPEDARYLQLRGDLPTHDAPEAEQGERPVEGVEDRLARVPDMRPVEADRPEDHNDDRECDDHERARLPPQRPQLEPLGMHPAAPRSSAVEN